MLAIENHIDGFVVITARVDDAFERRESNALRRLGPFALLRQRFGAVFYRCGKLLRLRMSVDQSPSQRFFCAQAFADGAKNIGVIAPHFALVGQPR